MTKRNQPTKVVLTMRRKDIRKRKGIRYAEYYNMVEIQDELYRQGMMKKKFYRLMPIIASPQNIRLAYRNLKNNKGSNTPGVDGKTFADYAKLEDVELIRKVQEKLLNYQPKAVRRVYIPKSNGKLRPLGIPTVLDRLVQQSILQVLEPVCESKFHRYSYGFRPNRSCKQAVAMCYKLAQVNGYHYVVDVDIKGFFDHVNHGKLLKQLWSLGIRDKSLLCVISRMLKAPVEENGKRTIPQEGTPQGGVLSPLLANIVLNELDWWIHSQWAGIPIHNPSPSEIWRTGPDGMLYRPGGNTKLQRCNLKHVYIVRYADDFKVFCRNYNAAKRLKIAVERWLLERLHLETSPEKSKITNLEESYSEFLGIKFKLIPKGQKWAIKSHMTDKAIKNQQKALKSLMVQACHDYGNPSVQHIFVNRYNQAVVGIHEYYSMATMVNEDMHRMFISIDKTMKCRCAGKNSLVREKPTKIKGGTDAYIFRKYGKSKQVRYINGFIIAPIAYCKHKSPMCHRPSINQYTPEGRRKIHDMLCKEGYADVLFELGNRMSPLQSVEYCDNRLARFVASKGKCEITGELLSVNEVHCHHFLPRHLGGTDQYSNLRIVHVDVHRLIHATTPESIQFYLRKTGCYKKPCLDKINRWRASANLPAITL